MELSAGVNPQARSLAGQIDQSRTAQIELMLGYLARPSPASPVAQVP